MRHFMPIVAALALLFVASPALAHPHATVFEANGNRCYFVTDGLDAGAPEYWLESNGLLEGGEAMGPPSEEAGLPVSGVPFWDLLEIVFLFAGTEPGDVDERFEDGDSGLQRGPTDTIPADTQVSADAWSAACLA